MVLHKCELCNYETKYTTHYNNHLLTKKHKQNKMNIYKDQGIRCPSCNIEFSTNSNMKRHLKKCKPTNELLKLKLENQKLYYENKMKEKDCEKYKEIIKEKEKCIEIIKDKNTTINNTTNNTMNTSIMNNNIMNNNFSIKFLNEKYPDTITMPDFLKSLSDCSLTDELINKMCNIHKKYDADSIAQVLIEIIKYHCEENKIKTVPVMCNDSKFRSHKEKTGTGWMKVLDKKNIANIYHEIVSKIIRKTDGMQFSADPDLCNKKITKSLLKNYDSPQKIEIITDD